MKTILHMHDFVSGLPVAVQKEIDERCYECHVVKGQAVYRQGDVPTEMYQLLRGGVKLCNYTLDGREIVSTEFLSSDWMGEMGMIDGLPRVSHAIAIKDSTLRVLSKAHFDELVEKYPAVSQQLNIMLCRRLRMAWLLREEGSSLSMHQCLARAIHRLSYSHGLRDQEQRLYIAFSQEELGRMLGFSRQSINKGVRTLVAEGLVDLQYGKIFIQNLQGLHEKYESLIGIEQMAAVYDEKADTDA